jgi:hypothetical protein
MTQKGSSRKEQGMCRKLVAVLALVVLCAGIVSAQEAPAEATAVVAETAATAPWWVDVGEVAVNWLMKALLALFFGYLMKKAHDNVAMQEAVTALEGGVQDAWVRFVKDLKKGLTDGKWDDEEKAKARTWAYEEALKIAKGPGRRLLISWAKPYVDSLISKIVDRRKGDKAGD